VSIAACWYLRESLSRSFGSEDLRSVIRVGGHVTLKGPRLDEGKNAMFEEQNIAKRLLTLE
jgi:hypothetical protein